MFTMMINQTLKCFLYPQYSDFTCMYTSSHIVLPLLEVVFYRHVHVNISIYGGVHVYLCIHVHM